LNRYWTYGLWVLVVGFLVAVGLFSGRFVLYLTMRVMILSIFAMGYNLLFGRTACSLSDMPPSMQRAPMGSDWSLSTFTPIRFSGFLWALQQRAY